jgi:hypothetical protein
VLGPAGTLELEVRFRPGADAAPEGLALLVSYGDASGLPEPDRLEPGELAIPLLRRLVGEAQLAASPATLAFGAVPVGTRRVLPVWVLNASSGNASLRLDGWDAGGAAVRVELPEGLTLSPDAGAELAVAFAPAVEQVLAGTLELSSSTPGVAPVQLRLEGTSLARGRLAILPGEGPVDLGEVPAGSGAVAAVRLVNQGGQAVTVGRVAVTDALHDLSARLAGAPPPRRLGPMESVELELVLDAGTPGVLAATVELTSDDPARPRLALPVTGLVTRPALQVSPTTVAFGTLPLGAVAARSVELRNTGYGPVVVRSLGLMGGSASVFSLRSLPALPATLQRDQRVALEVQFLAEGAAPFSASLAVETDLPGEPTREVPVRGTGASCQAACPLPHATASCASGGCRVGACDPGWYDADGVAGDGCECRERGTDPPGFCGSAADLGTLADSGASASFTGLLATPGDVDWLRFFGEDQDQLFSDAYRVQVQLTSADPSVQLCVYRFDTSAATSACFEVNEACGRSFSRAGSWGRDDGAEYYLRVSRAPGAAPTCTPYTVAASNGG